jgi:hypothetical protein
MTLIMLRNNNVKINLTLISIKSDGYLNLSQKKKKKKKREREKEEPNTSIIFPERNRLSRKKATGQREKCDLFLACFRESIHISFF